MGIAQPPKVERNCSFKVLFVFITAISACYGCSGFLAGFGGSEPEGPTEVTKMPGIKTSHHIPFIGN